MSKFAGCKSVKKSPALLTLILYDCVLLCPVDVLVAISVKTCKPVLLNVMYVELEDVGLVIIAPLVIDHW